MLLLLSACQSSVPAKADAAPRRLSSVIDRVNEMRGGSACGFEANMSRREASQILGAAGPARLDRPFPSTRPDTAPAQPRRRRAAPPLRRRRHPRERHEGADQGRAPQNHAAQPPGPRRLALHRHENQPGFRGDDGAGNLSPRARRRPGPAAALTPPTPPRRTALPAPPFREGGGRGRMLEIAQTPCAVHGGSAERDDDKQQVRSERLSRSCGEVPLARLCLNPRTRIDHHPLLFCLARALLVLPRRGRAENGLILFSCCSRMV